MHLGPGEFALTFDDGPLPYTTPAIAKVLKSRCVPATFFMVGLSSRILSPIAALVEKAGFTIGTHTYTHKDLTTLSEEKAEAQIIDGMIAVEKATGGISAGEGRLFRFPRWKSTPELETFVKSMGATRVNADISPEDWRGRPAKETFAVFKQRLGSKDRGVIGLHDVKLNTIDLVPMIIDEIHARGGTFVQLVPKRKTPVPMLNGQ